MHLFLTILPLAFWFGSQSCPALDGSFSGSRVAPPVKTGRETLVIPVPRAVLAEQNGSMTVPWYVFDSVHDLALSHVGGDSGVVWTIRAVSGKPPAPLDRVDLRGVHTTSGLRVGSSASQVIRLLGKPLVVRACGLERFEYSDDKDPDAERNDVDFTIRNGRVIEIAHTSLG